MKGSNMSAQQYVTVEACNEWHKRGEEQYRDLCKRMDGISSRLDTLHSSLYVDNGKTSIQTRLDRHDRVIKTIMWISASYIGAVVPGTVWLTVSIVKHVYGL